MLGLQKLSMHEYGINVNFIRKLKEMMSIKCDMPIPEDKTHKGAISFYREGGAVCL